MGFGELEKTALIVIIADAVLGFIIYLWMDMVLFLFLFISMVFYNMAFIYIGYVVVSSKCKPLIDKNTPEELTWHRFTKDGMYLPQTVKKSAYGTTKGVQYGKKAYIINKGDFPIRSANGNQGIIVFDMRCTNVNLKHVAAWQRLFKKFNVRSGKDAYKRCKAEGKTVVSAEKATADNEVDKGGKT